MSAESKNEARRMSFRIRSTRVSFAMLRLTTVRFLVGTAVVVGLFPSWSGIWGHSGVPFHDRKAPPSKRTAMRATYLYFIRKLRTPPDQKTFRNVRLMRCDSV